MPASDVLVVPGVLLLVLLIWMLTTSEPMTGPSVQKPMADARPSCGLKSRISAGVATRMMPSTRPMAPNTMAKPILLSASGMPSRHSRATTTRPARDDVDPAVLVGDAGDERRDGAEDVADHRDVDVVDERHVVVDEDAVLAVRAGGDGAGEIELVVEDDRREHDDARGTGSAGRCWGRRRARYAARGGLTTG